MEPKIILTIVCCVWWALFIIIAVLETQELGWEFKRIKSAFVTSTLLMLILLIVNIPVYLAINFLLG